LEDSAEVEIGDSRLTTMNKWTWKNFTGDLDHIREGEITRADYCRSSAIRSWWTLATSLRA
jgi:hypothetical protein